METRVATLGIIVEKEESVEKLNQILHEFRDCVIGRMGMPYRKRNINIICLAVDATNDEINSLTGKIGSLEGVRSKACYSQFGA